MKFNDLAIGTARRILILGPPGSGKSTFAKVLAQATGIPHLESDAFFWRNQKGGAIREDFESCMANELAKESWIVEGLYRKIESFLPRPDLILILGCTWPTLLWRIGRRDIREFYSGRRVTSDLIWILKNRGNVPRFQVSELALRWGADVRTVET